MVTNEREKTEMEKEKANKQKYILNIIKFLDNGRKLSENLVRCNSIKEINTKIEKDKKSDFGLSKSRIIDITYYEYVIYNLNDKITNKINLVENLN